MIRFFDRIPPAWKAALGIGLSARLGLALWGAVIYLVGISPELIKNRLVYYWGIPPITDGIPGAMWGVWQRWDAIHYMRIAQSGYSHEDLSVFLHLYPSLSSILSFITGLDSLTSLTLLSLVCAILSMVLIFSIISERLDPHSAVPALLFFVLFPTSFFYFIPYPQSLGLLLVVLATWAALHHRWWLAALCGLAAGLTHFTLLAVSATLTMLAMAEIWPALSRFFPTTWQSGLNEILKPDHGEARPHEWIAVLAAISPIIGGILFLLWRMWQGFPPLDQFQLFRWERTTQWPWITIFRLSSTLESPWFGAVGWINLLCFLFIMAVCVWSVRRTPAWMWTYQLVAVFVLLSTGTVQDPLGGFGRYMLCLYPMFIALAYWTQSHKRLRFYIFVFLGLIQLYLSFLYIQWVWIG